jgi:two-component system response regulator YesN
MGDDGCLYKVMIVDDEPLVRLAMHQIISWKDINMEIVAEAGDGADALAVLQQRNDIDILLVDIQMPKMSGIELLGAIQTMDAMKKPIPIVLSAFSDYSYVREAFLLGAVDFIVKVNMDEEHILPVLLKVERQLQQRQDSLHDSQEIHHPEGEKEDRDRVIEELLSLDIQSNALEYSRLVSEVCNCLGEINQVAVAVSIAGSTELISKKVIKQTIRTEMDSALLKHLVYCVDANTYLLLLAVPQLRSDTAIREIIHTTLTLIQIRLEQYMNVRISLGISDAVEGKKHWYRLINQARRLATLCFFERDVKFFYPEYEINSYKETSDELRITLKAGGKEIVRLIELENESRWELEFDRYAKKLKEKVRYSVHEAKLILTDFLWELGSLLYTQDLRGRMLFDHIHYFEQLKNFHTLEDTLQWIRQVCSDTYYYVHDQSKKVDAPYSIVEKAKEFIDQHYCEELSLGMVSEWVGVSENYLSKLFMKNVGDSFIQYVTNLRIEESKRLLKKGYKIIDISAKVGYMNSEHFSRMFKKVTGVSPKVYRENLGSGATIMANQR